MSTKHRTLLLTLAALTACGPGGLDHGHDHGDHTHGPTGEAEETPISSEEEDTLPWGVVAVPPQVRRNLGMTFAPVEVRTVEDTLRIPGSFELPSRARREYRTPLRGRIELLVAEYQTVEPGTPLYRFQSPTWPELLHEILTGEQARRTADAEIALADARITEARVQLEGLRARQASLAELGQRPADLEQLAHGLEASLPRLRAELEVAQARLLNATATWEHALHRAAAAAGLTEEDLLEPVGHGGELRPRYMTMDWIEVQADEPGRVEHLAVPSGAFLEAASPVVRTVDLTRLRFRALALQADLEELLEPRSVRIVPASGAVPPLDASLSLGLEAHPSERTIEVLGEPTELAAWARPGVTAFLEIVLRGEGERRFAVPARAVVQDGLTQVLFRRDPGSPDRVLRVEADLGATDGSWVVLESGVGPGDEVVLDGVYELKLATQQGGGPQPGGHFHADGSFHEDH
ncbi:MAG: hypothetical protein O2799_01565 [Planctomycetota bacterium]|nr:hypothetical protein [Planctomycetota bacterium]